MNRLEEIRNLQKLKELAPKYSNYKSVVPSKIKYHPIQNDIQANIARKVGKQQLTVLAIVTIAFGASGILALTNDQTTIGLLILLMTLVLTIFFINIKRSKPQVVEGKAVWKNWEYSNSNSNSNRTSKSKMYFVSVAIEEQNIICSRIQTNRDSYNKIEEGTPVIIIKKGSIYYACTCE